MTTRIGDERGLTLIEMLVTVVVLGTGFVTILAGLTTTMRSTSLHRAQAAGETIVRRYAEAIDAAPYQPCATDAEYASAFTAPDGWTAQVEDVAYWDPATTTFTGTCPDAGDAGAQELSLVVRSTTEDVQESLDVVKRVP